MPTTMPTSRTVSTVSTVRTQRYGGSTLRYGLYGTKYLLATMPTTVPTTMPGPTRTVSTVSTVRTLRYGGSTLQYGLYGAKYLLLLYGTVSSGPITCYPITMLPWYALVRGSTSSSGSNTSLCRRVQIAPTKRLRGCPRPPPAPRQLQRRLRRVKTAKTVGLRASGSSTPPQSHTSAPRRPQ